MSGAAGQAAGLAVGAAVGAVIGGVTTGGVGTGAGAVAGASLGSAAGSLVTSLFNVDTQNEIDTATLKLNQEQAHAKAAAQSAIHAQKFRQALASQMALSTMRGGSGSVATQFGAQSYRNFIEDQQAIERGVDIADVQASLTQAEIDAKKDASQTKALNTAATTAISAFDSINLNKPRSK